LILKAPFFMKKVISAFAVLAIVGSALAFKPFGSGSVFCNSACTSRIDFRVSPTGTITDPCENGANGEFVLTADNTCVQVATGTHFVGTASGK
jgi:hypothetical protein